MEKMLQDISSLYWWVGVVAVGITINIISAYLKSFAETKLSKISVYWRQKKQARVERFDKKLNLLRKNSDLKRVYALRQPFFHTISLSIFMIGILLLLLGFYFKANQAGSISTAFCFLFSTFFVLMSQLVLKKSWQVLDLIEAATDGIEELDKE